MTEDDELDRLEEEDSEAVEEGEEGASKPKLSRKKRAVLLAVPLILILIILGVFYFASVFDSSSDEALAEEQAQPNQRPPIGVFVDFDPLVTTFRGKGSGNDDLRIGFRIEVPDQQQAMILENNRDRVVDRLIPYLRSLRDVEVSGDAALVRIKEEVEYRIRQEVPGVEIVNVLYTPTGIQTIYR